MAPRIPTFGSSSSSSSSSDDEHEAEQRHTTKNPPILPPAPTDQEQEGDSYESDDDDDDDDEEDVDEGGPVGASNVTAKLGRGPSPPPHLQGLPEPHTTRSGNVPSPKLTKPSPSKRTATAAGLAEPSPSKKKAVPSKSPPAEKPAASGEHHHTKSQNMATPAKEVSELPKKAVAAKKVAKLPEKAPTAKKVAKAPPLKKAAAAGTRQAARNRKEVAKQPPPSKAAAAGAGQAARNRKEVAKQPLASKAKAAAAAAVDRQTAGKEAANNAEKRWEEKSETYWHLAQAVKELETKHNAPGLFKAAFLSIADDKAAMLNTKIKKQEMAVAKLYLKRHDITKQVIRVLSKLVK